MEHLDVGGTVLLDLLFYVWLSVARSLQLWPGRDELFRNALAIGNIVELLFHNWNRPPSFNNCTKAGTFEIGVPVAVIYIAGKLCDVSVFELFDLCFQGDSWMTLPFSISHYPLDHCACHRQL